MFNNTNRVAIVAAVVIALFTPVVSWAFAILGFMLGITFTILGAINPLGLVFVTLVAGGLWVAYNRGVLEDFFLGNNEEDEEEDWTL
jgi:hypothetical protein